MSGHKNPPGKYLGLSKVFAEGSISYYKGLVGIKYDHMLHGKEEPLVKRTA